MDKIWIQGLRAWGRHGVDEAERQEPQELEIDLELVLDLSLAGSSDRLDDTVDYKRLVEKTAEIVSNTSYHLLEALGERIAAEILSKAKVEIRELTVSITKLSLPIDADLDAIRVQITRSP